MIVDSSVLTAIVLGEPGAEACPARLAPPEEPVRVSAVNLVEASVVVEARQGPDATGISTSR